MPRRILQGVVTSDVLDKTITIRVERRIKHPMYKKIITKSSKFMAHDEKNFFKKGSIVSIEECRPLSKNKKWKVIYPESE
jgi:small subunit ribosomal protein S17